MNTANQETQPNYRIYDRTGGGVTQDIYATSLEDAIEQGREWIEDGDWSGCSNDNNDGDGKTYRTIELDCVVREIVRYPESDEDGDGGKIDEQATRDGQSYDCSGLYSDPQPECEATGAPADADADAQGHVWRDLADSTRSHGGTAMSYRERCRHCGCLRITHTAGSQRNPDEPSETVTIRERDEAATAWLKRIHEDDDFVPAWLAEMLDCSMSMRMTKDDATAYVRDNDDDSVLDYDDLEHAYAATFGCRATDKDRAEGLWSHLNA